MVEMLTVADLGRRGAVLVAECGTHLLFRMPAAAERPLWQPFYLRLRSAGQNPNQKKTWWLSHNRTRFAGSSDLCRLAADWPEVYDWLQNLLDDRPDG